jgi:hypothetical protein
MWPVHRLHQLKDTFLEPTLVLGPHVGSFGGTEKALKDKQNPRLTGHQTGDVE